MIISLDTETCGIDFIHGAMPFFVTTCSDDGTILFWEWDVNPLTRKPEIPDGDLADIAEMLDAADLIYLQNSKFDARALIAIGLELPWDKVRDTLVMGHLLASNHRHDLTWMCVEYLGVDIEPFEKDVEDATKLARRIAKKDYPTWQLASKGLPNMPSVKGGSKRDEDKPWKNDMWLPRALIKAGMPQYAPQHWQTACSKYANADSEHTLYLGLEMEKLIRDRGLWAIYEERMKLPRIACEIECYGVTAIGDWTEATIQEYTDYVEDAEQKLVEIAAGYSHELQLAKGAAINNNMREFFYKGLELPIVYSKKTGNATLDKEAMQEYLTTTEGPPHDFVKTLTLKRNRDTAISYMQAYRRFWVPVVGSSGYYHIHPNLNPCGTDHLRWASNSPNLQNVGKQEMRCESCDGEGCDECGGTGLTMMSARNCFGPAPGREWLSMDYESIEKRIPAFECVEPALIEIFDKPNEPPYWGSDHNLLASLLWPDKYNPIAHIKGEFKKRYINEYKRAKNTNFAKQYGAGKRKVDTTAGIVGAFERIDRGMPLLAALQAKYLDIAERTGFVETIPDKSVDPTRGYPILASRTEDGRVLSTTPFNYHVSGSACWCKNKALVRCSEQLRQWRREGFDGDIALEIHDEILFDFPRGKTLDENKGRALILKGLMEKSGDDIGIPCPVSAELHTESWAKGVSI